MYDPADCVVPTDGFEVNDGLPWAFREPLTVQTGPFRPSRAPSEGRLRRLQALVRGLVRQIDDSIGRILSAVDLDRSVVCFTSDHGDYGGHRGMLRKVPWIPFDDLWRVPFVVSAPDMVGGRRQAGMVQNLDWVTTALDYAGVPFDPGVFGSGACGRRSPIRPGSRTRTARCSAASPTGGPRSGWATSSSSPGRTSPCPVGPCSTSTPIPVSRSTWPPTRPGWPRPTTLEDLLRRSVYVPPPELPGRVGSGR